ncbi:DUF4407 domain-containing protein [Nonomuraea soli]|uniref:DUF4407 domain-containing protein n=1 Tax=Nonomuraea soli TaxID=1032476 RepID=A0A7W0CHX6_9ACTN|nr:DUF4407 domain-containing protein [Nonomuraea soli]MBA2891302.1 hypothetical protein [Nonomuraea soli]
MTTTQDAPVQRIPLPPPPRGGRGLGRLLRRIIGVQEDVLAWVPEDRAKLSRTGAIVVCTALIAGVSVYIVLHEFLQAPLPLSIGGALFWAAVIGVFDSWLISSSQGVIGPSRFFVLLPRLFISVIIGVLISEPVTLKVFESAIVEQIKEDQVAAVDAVRTKYGNCYPKPQLGADCSDAKLTIAAPDPAALKRAIEQRDQLAKDLKPLNKEENRLSGLKMDECAGYKTSGEVSGIQGRGLRCIERERALEDYRATNGLAAKQASLKELGIEVNRLMKVQADLTGTYEKQVTEQIEAKVEEERDKHAAVPGLLERFDGLSSLADKSWAVWWAHLLLAGLLVLIDCFPVLTKLISKPTAYDRRIATQLESRERMHDNDLRLTERLRTGDGDVRLHQEDARVRQAMEESDYDGRLQTARREVELRARIDALVAEAKGLRS